MLTARAAFVAVEAAFNPFATSAAGRARHRQAARRMIDRAGRGAPARHFEQATTRQIRQVEAQVRRGETSPVLPANLLREAYSDFYFDVLPVIARRVFLHGEAALRQVDFALDEEWRRVIDEFLGEEGALRVALINATTTRTIQAVLAEGVAERWGPIETARQLRKRWDGLSRMRAERIARTEMLGAMNRGSLLGARSTRERFGVEMEKVWQWSGIARETHQAVSGQAVALDGLFLVDGESMAHPGDQAASAKNVIHCGCTMYYQVRA